MNDNNNTPSIAELKIGQKNAISGKSLEVEENQRPASFSSTTQEKKIKTRKRRMSYRLEEKEKEVFEHFEPKKMWDTLIKMSHFDRFLLDEFIEVETNCYDPRLVLCTLVQMVRPGTTLDCKQLVHSNALAFCLALTSFYSSDVRTLAYSFLERFRRRLLELNEEYFKQRRVIWNLLTNFKNSILRANQRITHVDSHFLARVSKLSLNPEDPVYAPLMSFLTQKPWIQLDAVPEFHKLFFSTSTEFYLRERQWMLRLLSNSIIDTYDYRAVCKMFVIESCMALFCTSMSDYWGKLIMLKIFHACVKINSVATDLLVRLNFATWLTNAVLHPRTTVLEQFELISVFQQMLRHFEAWLKEDASNVAKSTKVKSSRRPLLRAIVQLNSKKILNHLTMDPRINTERDIVNREQLVVWIKKTLC